MKIGLYFKKDSSSAQALTKRIIDFLKRNNTEVFIEKNLKSLFPDVPEFDISKDNIDVIIVVGGDGTVIRVLHELRERIIPLMTVRMGKRGVLLDVSPIEIEERLKDLLEGRYVLREYERIFSEINKVPYPPAINEIVLVASSEYYRSKVIRFSVHKDHYPIYYLEGDGVIIATPIGSSAYSLAAGGPLLDRSVKAMVITPLAPIYTWARSVVVPIDSTISIHLKEGSLPGEIVIDGYERALIKPGDTIIVRRYPQPAKIIRFHEDERLYEEIFGRK